MLDDEIAMHSSRQTVRKIGDENQINFGGSDEIICHSHPNMARMAMALPCAEKKTKISSCFPGIIPGDFRILGTASVFADKRFFKVSVSRFY